MKMSTSEGALRRSDRPIETPGEDRFRRAPFANSIAKTLLALRDESSIAIGIYGPWGDGKTSVLSLIGRALQDKPEIITVSFNPWRFGDEDELLHSFFSALVAGLGRSLSSVKKFVHDWKTVFTFVPYAGGAAEKIVERLTVEKLEDFKSKTEKILEQEGKRIVVLMDDIDRLETNEIQAVFRLIKLTASFNYVAYVLAFDDKVVAAALQEKYGAVSKSGQGFLEKIIQVPLQLPNIPTGLLLNFCYECVEGAISATGLELTDEQTRKFRNGLALIATQVRTPRQCKRYANAVPFALDLLAGEVNVVDLLLVEALRVFHPWLYRNIRLHRDYFISGTPSSSIDPRQFDMEVMPPAWEGLNTQEQKLLRTLLLQLFPDFGKDVLQRRDAGLYDALADDQRVASKHYFDRFFTYSIPGDEVLDVEIDELLSGISARPVDEIASQIRNIMNRDVPRGADSFIFRLGLRRKLLSPTVSPNLAKGIAATSENFSSLFKEKSPYRYSDAVLLVRQLLLNSPRLFDDPRLVMADIIKHSVSVSFAYWCLQAAMDANVDQKSWFEIYGGTTASPGHSTSPPIVQDEFLTRTMAARIRSYFDDSRSYEIRDIEQRDESRFLVEAWVNKLAAIDEVRQHLEKGVKANPGRAVGIINWYLRDPLDDNSFARERYDSITKLVKADILVAALEKKHGKQLKIQETSGAGLKLAQAFLRLYDQFK
jgi:hypothetical protein